MISDARIAESTESEMLSEKDKRNGSVTSSRQRGGGEPPQT